MKVFANLRQLFKRRFGKKRLVDSAYAGRVCPYCGGTGLRNDTTMYPLQLHCNVCGGKGRIPS